MAQEKFQVGDVVTLKSGGPEMTVQEVYNNDDWCKCTWFLDGKRYNDSFREATIELALED